MYFHLYRHQKGHRHWLSICKQLCQAVHYLHWMGFVHNDIKPGNILYDYFPSEDRFNIYLSDFGLSALENRSYPGGTDKYRPPEMMLRHRKAAFTTDHYAVAMTMLALIDKHKFPCGSSDIKRNVEELSKVVLDNTMTDVGVLDNLYDVLVKGLYNLEDRQCHYDELLFELEIQKNWKSFDPS